MSLEKMRIAENYDMDIVSESVIDSLKMMILSEECTTDELEQFMATEAYNVLTERSIVKLDKKAKKNKAIQMAILQCAKEDGNKDYLKLATLWKMEKILMAKINKRYKAKGMARAKKAAKSLGNSTSNTAKSASRSAGRKMTQFERKMANNNKILKSKPIAQMSAVNKIKV